MNNSIFILLGSNLGDRNSHLTYGRQEISRAIGEIITISSIYKTAAWGNQNQPAFYNQVIEIKSVLPPQEMLSELLKIEKNAGRVREERWGPRTLDIDILFYGNVVIESDTLTVPHPRIADRRFTLLPLSEIAPDLIHPVTGQTISEILRVCPDNLPVEKLNY
jgi:2-amino-4-hydroxy-6-hydroxymethyldihydropteridine diphosphokinase